MIGQGIGPVSAAQLVDRTETNAMTVGMMLGAGVMIVTQLILVAIAIVWYVRSQRQHDRQN
jgi:fucose permease